jgi:8-amino-7-oxononanoate synthase
MSNPYKWIDQALHTIHRANWHRSPQPLPGRPAARIQLAEQELLNFASNDYLGLAGDERLVQAAIAAATEFGTGSTGSRLLSGHRDLHQQLEQAIANLKQTEDAIVFSSGYLANLGAIAAVVGQRDLILSDQYNHASLKNGAILSKATVLEYTHCHMAELRTKLNQHRDQYRRCLVITDSVFSMDGDLCPLPELLDLAAQFDCMVLVDEAHATGVLGVRGAGAVEALGCTGHTLIQVGTLSKALGSLGGYVAGSAALIDFLRNRASSWIYTTGLSPADTAAALAAIAILEQEPERRTKLWQNVAYFRQHLAAMLLHKVTEAPYFQLLPSDSPILCLQMSGTAAVLAGGQQLREAGIFVAAIRPPTVPTSRLRLTVMATHQYEDCDRVVSALAELPAFKLQTHSECLNE